MKFSFLSKSKRQASRGRGEQVLSGSSADCQSAVSPTASRRPVGQSRHSSSSPALSIAKPRHSSFETCVTNNRITTVSSATDGGERGVALVITLILLSVITFMAVTFLVVTRGERSTVSVITEQTTAKLAADAGFEAAKAQLLAPMLAFTNASTVRLLVSTNYQAPWYTNGIVSYLNVNYRDQNGQPVYASGVNNYLQMLNNLYYLPRAPVVRTNGIYGSNEFLYYLDLNRNGGFDTNGLIFPVDKNGQYFDASGNPTPNINNAISQNVTGDPEWVGILERGAFNPSLLKDGTAFLDTYGHSSSNLFISRYAYVVVPTSAALDINYIHNYAKMLSPNMAPNGADGFFRNMGVGSWEINLAAFLADLNTNMWPSVADTIYGQHYLYNTNNASANSGAAFQDAYGLLRYRYANNWNGTLARLNTYFGNTPGPISGNDYADVYSSGPLMVGFHWDVPVDLDATRAGRFGWAGSDNTNHFFDTQDFFDPTKTGAGFGTFAFTNRLFMAGTNTDSYDRYTYYRMLEQLGAESAPEPPKLNLNYRDVTNGVIVPNIATNLQPWNPVEFFTNAVGRMLVDAGYDTNVVLPNGQLHIQFTPTNYYTPSVHRYLQLAANILDATTNRTFGAQGMSNGFPSVFRPYFKQEGLDPLGRPRGYIVGYTEVKDASMVLQQPPLYFDRHDSGIWRRFGNRDSSGFNVMAYGVPLIIGAKKGFPSFNEFGSLNRLTVARRMVLHRDPGAAPSRTNQYFTVGISNAFGMEFWNSYSNTYNRQLSIVVSNEVLISLTNEMGVVLRPDNTPFVTNLTVGSFTNFTFWPGYRSPALAFGFYSPPATAYVFLTNAVYSPQANRFVYPGTPIPDAANQFIVPRWYIQLTNRVRAAIVDTSVTPNRIIDYINLENGAEPLEISSTLMDGADCASPSPSVTPNSPGYFWCTNRYGGIGLGNMPFGLMYQFNVSAGTTPISDSQWRAWNFDANDKRGSILGFQRWLANNGTNLDMQAPFTPYRTVFQKASWQANDPLVHYTVDDLKDLLSKEPPVTLDTEYKFKDPFSTLLAFGNSPPLNTHYRPWRGNPNTPADTSPPTKQRLDIADPLINKSDDWDFPTNKYPNIGWLGRVHRGTPWQTVYLKSSITDSNTWNLWSGHTNNMIFSNFVNNAWVYSINYDYVHSSPTNDFRLFDLFTTALNENASRGQLSVNQTNLAAWSAVLSGVAVLTNADPSSAVIIEPAGTYNGFNTNAFPPLAKIVAGLNRTRQVLQPSQSFSHIGDILFTPELTVQSPYITTINPALNVNDDTYERIPQQILSLLRNDSAPRFIVYSFGQALKPAEHSIYMGGGKFFGMVTNYQITAEAVTRAVVRVEGAPTQPHVVVESYNVLPAY